VGFIGRRPRVSRQMDGRRAILGIRASATRRASRGAGAVGQRPWGRDALPPRCRHGETEEGEKKTWKGLTCGSHMAVKREQRGWWYAGWWAERPSGPAALAGRQWEKVGVIWQTWQARIRTRLVCGFFPVFLYPSSLFKHNSNLNLRFKF
jgi:hypothetical protein